MYGRTVVRPHGARFYSPGLGRFVSADTVVPNPLTSQLLNRYSYAGNNPVLYNDPDGHCGPLCAVGLAAVLLTVAVIPSDVHHFERGICPQHQCAPLARYNATVAYMHEEMTNNAQGVVVQEIQQMEGNLKKGVWGIMVAPHSFWDHKPKLESMLGLNQEVQDYYFPLEGDQDYEYYYDIWSNIHYGYVGTAAGFDAETLQSGAAVPWFAGTNDAYDELSIQIGIELWNRYGLDLTEEQLRDAILAHRDEYIRIWREVYGENEDLIPPPIPKTNGR